MISCKRLAISIDVVNADIVRHQGWKIIHETMCKGHVDFIVVTTMPEEQIHRLIDPKCVRILKSVKIPRSFP
jgi:hypothetical protein